MTSERLVSDREKKKSSCLDIVFCVFCGVCKRKRKINERELQDVNKNTGVEQEADLACTENNEKGNLIAKEEIPQHELTQVPASVEIKLQEVRDIKINETQTRETVFNSKTLESPDLEIHHKPDELQVNLQPESPVCSTMLHSTGDERFEMKGPQSSDVVSDIRKTPEGSEISLERRNNEIDSKLDTTKEDNTAYPESVFHDHADMDNNVANNTKYFSLSNENKEIINTEPLLYTQSDLDEVVRAREVDWKKKYEELESKIKEEIAMRELLEQDHKEKMECLRKENLNMKQVVAQYEKTIVDLTENSHHNHMFNEETLSETVRAKEQLQQELSTAEQNLVDAYKRIDKLKRAVDTFKQNEEDLKQSCNEFQIKLKRSEERYQKLKQHAAEKVESANIEISKVRKQKEIDLAGVQAALKKAQSKIHSLEQEVQQKVRENAEYAQICDDLIKKVSGE